MTHQDEFDAWVMKYFSGVSDASVATYRAMEKAFDAAYQLGQEDGVFQQEDIDEAYNAGHEAGYDVGSDEGYAQGHEEGLEAALGDEA